MRISILLLCLACVNASVASREPPGAIQRGSADTGLAAVLQVMRHVRAFDNDKGIFNRCTLLRATGVTVEMLDSTLAAQPSDDALDSALTRENCVDGAPPPHSLSYWGIDSVHTSLAANGRARATVFAWHYYGSVFHLSEFMLLDQAYGLRVHTRTDRAWSFVDAGPVITTIPP